MPITSYVCPHGCGEPIHTDGLLDGKHHLGCGEDIDDYWDPEDGWQLEVLDA